MFSARDNEVEDTLYRDTENFNKHIEEFEEWNIKKAKAMLNDEYCENLAGLVPGMTNANRRDNVIKWLRANKAMRTLDPDVLYQRIKCQIDHYGDMSKAVRPMKTRPMADTYSRYQKKLKMMIQAQQDQFMAAEPN